MDIQELVNSYTDWLRKEISVAKCGEYFELTTPYLDRFNDYLQIYVKQEENGNIKITDDGYIIANLLSSGVSLKEKSKNHAMLEKTLRTYGLCLVGEQLMTFATASDFPRKKHLFVQAMLSIDDMFEPSKGGMKNFFVDDIETFLNANDIFYSRDFSLLGKTGSIHTYDFHFQRTKTQPERFCKAINKVNESNRNLTIFNWIDTKEQRGNEGNLIVIVNDENRINDSDRDAFLTYEITMLPYSKRGQYINLLKAA